MFPPYRNIALVQTVSARMHSRLPEASFVSHSYNQYPRTPTLDTLRKSKKNGLSFLIRIFPNTFGAATDNIVFLPRMQGSTTSDVVQLQCWVSNGRRNPCYEERAEDTENTALLKRTQRFKSRRGEDTMYRVQIQQKR